MTTLRDIVSLAIPAGIFLICVVVFILIFRHVRRRGSNYTHIFLGATYEALNEDRRKAGEVILNKKAGKKEQKQNPGQLYDNEDGPSPPDPDKSTWTD